MHWFLLNCLLVLGILGSEIKLRVYGFLPHLHQQLNIFEVIVNEEITNAEKFFVKSSTMTFEAVLDLDNDGQRDEVRGPLIPVEMRPFAEAKDWRDRSADFLFELDTVHLRVLGQYLASLFQLVTDEWLPSFIDTVEELDFILGLCMSGGGSTSYYLGWVMPWTPEYLLRNLRQSLRSHILDCLVIGDNIRGAWISTPEYNRLRNILSPATSPESSSPNWNNSSSEDEGATLRRSLDRIMPPTPKKKPKKRRSGQLERKSSFQLFQEVRKRKEAEWGRLGATRSAEENTQSASEEVSEDQMIRERPHLNGSNPEQMSIDAADADSASNPETRQSSPDAVTIITEPIETIPEPEQEQIIPEPVDEPAVVMPEPAHQPSEPELVIDTPSRPVDPVASDPATSSDTVVEPSGVEIVNEQPEQADVVMDHVEEITGDDDPGSADPTIDQVVPVSVEGQPSAIVIEPEREASIPVVQDLSNRPLENASVEPSQSFEEVTHVVVEPEESQPCPHDFIGAQEPLVIQAGPVTPVTSASQAAQSIPIVPVTIPAPVQSSTPVQSTFPVRANEPRPRPEQPPVNNPSPHRTTTRAAAINPSSRRTASSHPQPQEDSRPNTTQRSRHLGQTETILLRLLGA